MTLTLCGEACIRSQGAVHELLRQDINSSKLAGILYARDHNAQECHPERSASGGCYKGSGSSSELGVSSSCGWEGRGGAQGGTSWSSERWRVVREGSICREMGMGVEASADSTIHYLPQPMSG